jgi:hypothetical protein
LANQNKSIPAPKRDQQGAKRGQKTLDFVK